MISTNLPTDLRSHYARKARLTVVSLRSDWPHISRQSSVTLQARQAISTRISFLPFSPRLAGETGSAEITCRKQIHNSMVWTIKWSPFSWMVVKKYQVESVCWLVGSSVRWRHKCYIYCNYATCMITEYKNSKSKVVTFLPRQTWNTGSTSQTIQPSVPFRSLRPGWSTDAIW